MTVNTQPVSQAKDADLRLSQAALERAAQRAREIAARTGTALVVSRNGKVERIAPEGAWAVHSGAEPVGE